MLWRSDAPAIPSQTAAGSACTEQQFEGERFTICHFDPSRQTLSLRLDDAKGQPLRTFDRLRATLGAQAGKVAFAMNAGMFDTTGHPVGLYVQDDRPITPINLRKASGNFYMAPNGIFWMDERGAHVATTDRYARAKPTSVRQATQSGPMLVIDGKPHPDFATDGESRHIRNGVGVARDGRAVFVISRGEVSFGKFARFFQDSLDCPNALYLDGYVSALWNPAAGPPKQSHPLGPMIVVSEQ